MTAVLVTGGAGFVGARMCRELAARHPDWEIVALDNLRRRGSELNIPKLAARGVRFVHGDIRSLGDLPDFANGPEFVIDCAAEPSVLSGVGDNPSYVVEANLFGTFNCLEYARQRSSNLIFLSTSRTYPIANIEALPFVELETRLDLPEGFRGEGISHHGIAEDFPIAGARSLYGSTKLASELLLEEYEAAYGLKAVTNRCGTITGPGQMGKVEQGVFALWVAAHYFGRSLKYIGYGGQGKQVRDFLHVDDLVDLVEWQIANLDRVAGLKANVGGGRSNSVSLQELTVICEAVTGKQITIDRIPETRPNDLRWYISDNRKVEAACGWQAKRDVAQMAADVLRWLQADEALLKPIFVK